MIELRLEKFQIFLVSHVELQSAILILPVERYCGLNKVYYENCIWDTYTNLRFACTPLTTCKCIANFFEENGNCLPIPTTRGHRLSSQDVNHYFRSDCK
ncbi:unnamed protein product [Dracunculus medinensis]|uniref:Secreted protein n=1 Tax=Dracunculus medinensis TaxID=318479 RepID=A0A0N4UBF5_DRAME|nr:unnamed protein product [Dracunculus medinensis]